FSAVGNATGRSCRRWASRTAPATSRAVQRATTPRAAQPGRRFMRIATAAAALALAIPAVAYAHHGWSSYDASRPLVVTGPVISSNYGNPHGSLEIRHEGALWSV